MGKITQKRRDEGGTLHPNNPHSGRYNFRTLCSSCPELERFIRPNPGGDNTIDFSDADAVICLNKALLSHYYDIKTWQIPSGYLCPPIPGRADYIHYLSDLLELDSQEPPDNKRQVKVLDIGTGASCIYPIIGSRSFGWSFRGTDIDQLSVKSARRIIRENPGLSSLIEVVLQKDKKCIFKGVIKERDWFDLTLCNPPFHSSLAEAAAGNQRKWKNLKKDIPKKGLNFGGQNSELWCPGGELAFLKQMITESKAFSNQAGWFTSLVSKADNVRPLKKQLSKSGAEQIRVVKMEQGQKVSRFIAWSFLTAEQQKSHRW